MGGGAAGGRRRGLRAEAECRGRLELTVAVVLGELKYTGAAVLAPSAGDALCPFEDVHETDCAGIFEGEGRGEAEDADGGIDDAGDVRGVVGSEDDKRL